MTARAFEYAVIRVVPRTDREEFINAGVLLYCQDAAFLSARVQLDERRLRALDPTADTAGIHAALTAITAACERPADGSLREGGGLGARFRWLAAPRSTVVQTGPVHAGVTLDPERELLLILHRMVGPADKPPSSEGTPAPGT